MLEVGCMCNAEALRGIFDLTHSFLERATEHDSSLVSMIMDISNVSFKTENALNISLNAIDAQACEVLTWKQLFNLSDACRKDLIYDRRSRLEDYLKTCRDRFQKTHFDSFSSEN